MYLFPKDWAFPIFDQPITVLEAAAELGVEVTYTGRQRPMLPSRSSTQPLIAQGVDGLAISANDADALVPTGRDALESGIPVVSWDSAIAEGGRTHMNQADQKVSAEFESKSPIHWWFWRNRDL